MEISREVFEQQRRPRFGTSNPERMQMAFWEWMIRGEEPRSLGDERGLAQAGWSLRDGKLKSTYGPYRARQLFEVALKCEDGPIWTFERMGQTETQLADGRSVCIGGEHEDFYDPDFCIYNDVVVLGPGGEVEIYGYPKEVFPPTDFHTATLVGNEIVILGCMGYQNGRRYGYTPMYWLDLTDYRIREMTSSGDTPGWISKHSARVAADGAIVVSGGEIVSKKDGREVYRPNIEEYALDINSGSWRKLTNRNWPQFAIRMEKGGLFVLEQWPKPEKLLPNGIEYSVLKCDSLRSARIVLGGVQIAIFVGVWEIRILVEGDLPAALVDRCVESVRAHAEKAVGEKCVLEVL